MDQVLDNTEDLQLENASFWQRFAAYLIDIILLFIIGFAVSFALGEGNPFSASNQPDPNTPPMQAMLEGLTAGYAKASTYINLLIGLLYFIFLDQSTSQGTFGKQAVGIKVVDEFGDRISTGKSAVRNILKVVLAQTCIGYFTYFMMLGKNKQTLHDMAGKTYVVKKH